VAQNEDCGLICVCGHSSGVDLRCVDTEVSSAEMDSSPGCEPNPSIDDIRK